MRPISRTIVLWVCTALIAWLCWLGVVMSVGSADWLPDFLKLPPSFEPDLLARRGQLGDAFGPFNALVSTFAFIGLLATLRTQQHQIKAQEAISERNDLLIRQQQFQEQFYRAVDAYRSLLSEVVVPGDATTHSGRGALNKIWSQDFLESIDLSAFRVVDKALDLQRTLQDQERAGLRSARDRLSTQVASALHACKTDDALLPQLLDEIGRAWHNVYMTNRFQLDSLLRAWYTCYRILMTSCDYGISEEMRKLYSASFRAQLSWIELAFLLINQSGLPGNASFPKACSVSNEFVTFDNFDSGHDLIVALLLLKVEGAPKAGPDTELTVQALGQRAVVN